jgi:hypothetical protein
MKTMNYRQQLNQKSKPKNNEAKDLKPKKLKPRE